MKENFTKADLKDGMVIVQRDGKALVVIGEMAINTDGSNQLCRYTNSLEWDNSNKFDIVQVYEPTTWRITLDDYAHFTKNRENDFSQFKLIWERKEKKEIKLTTEERAFLNSILLVSNYKYIARDKDDELYVYKHKPNRGLFIARWMGIECCKEELKNITEQTENMFEFITWDDEEPYLIEDLLKL